MTGEKKFPPRTWIACSSIPFNSGAQYVYAYRERKYPEDVEYLSKIEAEQIASEREAAARADGIRDCIKALRELQDKYRHQQYWNSSAVTTFAPVELSDWILVNVLNQAAKAKLRGTEGDDG